MDLNGRCAGRQREIKRIDQPSLKQSSEPPKRRLGLARPGLGFEDHETIIERMFGCKSLLQARLAQARQDVEARATLRSGVKGAGIEPDAAESFARQISRLDHIGQIERVHISEIAPVRAKPIGQGNQSAKQMGKVRRRRQRRRIKRKCGGKPRAHQCPDFSGSGFRVIAGESGPTLARLAGGSERAAMMRQRREKEMFIDAPGDQRVQVQIERNWRQRRFRENRAPLRHMTMKGTAP
ncbi:hypothetical protein M2323_003911 [Rhodoblastus acidophilus]|nr:hypothetical protein [Rhodoblastus acidophilus]MCW2334968.1 hypothetical protein [Rhodoblastus acidophilus]